MKILRTILLCLIGILMGITLFLFMYMNPDITSYVRIKIFVLFTGVAMGLGIIIDRFFSKYQE